MAISSLGQRTSNFTATTSANAEFHTGSTKRCKLMEMSWIVQGTGTAQSIGLGRPAAQTTTPTNVAFQPDDPNDLSLTNGAVAWTTSATVPTQYHRRWSCAATTGVGVTWTFPRGLGVNASSTLVVWNITTTVAADVNFVVDE